MVLHIYNFLNTLKKQYLHIKLKFASELLILYFDDFAYIMQNNCSLDSNQNSIENNDKNDNNEYFKNLDIYEDEVEDNESNNKEEKKE